MMFRCDKCGKCCRNLNRSPIYQALHSGDGVCKFLNKNECSIYSSRPLICRVDESYNIFFKDKISYDEYLKINYQCCEILKRDRKK